MVVATIAALAALLISSPRITAQPVPPPGLRSVTHDSTLTGSGTVAAPLGADLNEVQARVTGTCGAGSAMTGVGSDGTVTCATSGGSGDITGVTAGSGLLGGGVSGTVNVFVNGATGGGLEVGADTVGLLSSCSLDEILKWTGLAWTCQADADSGGDITGVTTTSPLSGGCTSGTCALTTSMATSRLLGRVTASTGVAEELTGTQATTLLDTFTSSLKGLAPASSGGTSNFLRADGTWAVPPGTSPTGSGSTGFIPKWTGTSSLGTSNMYDTGTQLQSSVPYAVFGNPSAASYALAGDNGTSAATTNNFSAVIGSNYGSFDTTGSALTNRGVTGNATATRSSGANALTNIGVYGNASGAQNNYSFYGAAGTLYNAGPNLLSDGPTTLGQTIGKTEAITAGGTQNDLAVAATTKVVVFTASSSVILTGIARAGGNVDGDELTFILEGSFTLQVSSESVSSTASNRITSTGDGFGVWRAPSVIHFVYVGGSTNRWRIAHQTRFANLVANSIAVSGGATFNGVVSLGDASGDAISILGTATFTPLVTMSSGFVSNAASTVLSNTLGANGIAIDRGTTPTQSQLLVRANSTSAGGLSLSNLAADSSQVGFDVEYVGSAWTARDTSVAMIAKSGDKLGFFNVPGTSAGANITTTINAILTAPQHYLDLATGVFVFDQIITTGNSKAGDNDSDYWNSQATLAFSGANVSVSGTGCTASGEAQSFTVSKTTSGSGTCTITFNRTFNSAPYCVGSDAAATAKTGVVRISASSTTGITITTSDTFDYNFFCPDRR